MPHPDPEQLRMFAKTATVFCALIVLAAVTVLGITIVRGQPIMTTLPFAFLLLVSAAGLFLARAGIVKKANAIEEES